MLSPGFTMVEGCGTLSAVLLLSLLVLFVTSMQDAPSKPVGGALVPIYSSALRAAQPDKLHGSATSKHLTESYSSRTLT